MYVYVEWNEEFSVYVPLDSLEQISDYIEGVLHGTPGVGSAREMGIMAHNSYGEMTPRKIEIIM
jgi:hypothetical protein